MITIDLIYVIEGTIRTMACCILFEDGQAKMLGPVPSKDAFAVLAPMLSAELPAEFPLPCDAETCMGMLHARNILARENLAGQAYPFRIP